MFLKFSFGFFHKIIRPRNQRINFTFARNLFFLLFLEDFQHDVDRNFIFLCLSVTLEYFVNILLGAKNT